MKTSELAEEIGINKLYAGRVRRKVSPNHDGGPLKDWEIEAIKKELGVLTKPTRKKLRGLFGDDRFPGFIEAITLDEGEKATVMIPSGFDPSMFTGREFYAEQREYAPGSLVYSYNPYRQDD